MSAVAAVALVGVFGVSAANAAPVPSVGTGSVAAAAEASRSAVGTEADGRELLAGLFFLQGETGKKFTELRSYTGAKDAYRENANAESRKAVGELLDIIAAKDSGFFSTFSSQLRSGDPRKVEAGMNAAVKLLTKVTVDAEEAGNAKDIGAGTGYCAVLALNVLIVVNAGGAVNVSVAINLQAWKYVVNASVAPSGGDYDITKEQQVADITRLVAV
ncbi:hypothetical protein [Streptomyces sp. NPDC059452]|uniref:hypothetical protein n=1 Tax=Streptomyces sp. NPDC059452 TaxID=3346835 RepID=UPI0036A0C4A0